MWSSSGEQVGVVRAHSSFLAAHRIGPVTCLAFAPYELLLASGECCSSCWPWGGRREAPGGGNPASTQGRSAPPLRRLQYHRCTALQGAPTQWQPYTAWIWRPRCRPRQRGRRCPPPRPRRCTCPQPPRPPQCESRGARRAAPGAGTRSSGRPRPAPCFPQLCIPSLRLCIPLRSALCLTPCSTPLFLAFFPLTYPLLPRPPPPRYCLPPCALSAFKRPPSTTPSPPHHPCVCLPVCA